MKFKGRLVSIILIGILVGVVAVKIQQSSLPMDARLVSPDDATRATALRVFAASSDGSKEKTVDALIARRVNNADAKQRQFSLYALRKSGLASDKIVDAVVRGFSDGDQKVREEAAAGVVEIGDPALQKVVDMLGRDEQQDGRLGNLISRGSPRVVAMLAQALNDKSDIAHHRAVALAFSRLPAGDMRVAAKSAVPELVAAVKSTDPALSLNAAFGLHNIEPDSTVPVPVFIRHVEMADWDKPEVRGWDAARALSEIPAAAPQSSPVFARALLRGNESFIAQVRARRSYVAELMETLAPRPRKPSALSWDLRDHDAVIRYRAAVYIGNHPKDYQALIPALATALDDKDMFVAARAAWALTQVGLQNTVDIAGSMYPKYVDLLGRVDTSVIPGFTGAMGRPFGGMDEPALPSIIDGVKTGHLRLEKADTILLGSSPKVAKFLEAAMSHNTSSEVRLMAAIALARIAPKTPELRHELQKGVNRTGKVGDDVKQALQLLDSGPQK